MTLHHPDILLRLKHYSFKIMPYYHPILESLTTIKNIVLTCNSDLFTKVQHRHMYNIIGDIQQTKIKTQKHWYKHWTSPNMSNSCPKMSVFFCCQDHCVLTYEIRKDTKINLHLYYGTKGMKNKSTYYNGWNMKKQWIKM